MSEFQLPDGSAAVLISSDTQPGLRSEAAAIGQYLASHSAVEPIDVARMLLGTRDVRRFRALVSAPDRHGVEAGLAAVAQGDGHPSVTLARGPAAPRRVGFVFPGQGSQKAGMGREYYETSSVYRQRADEIDAEFIAIAGIAPLAYLRDASHDEDVRIVQPAIFLHTLALAAMWRAVGIAPDATIGHSQGEIAAVVASGVMTLQDGIRVVAGRAVQIDWVENLGDFPPCAMAVVATTRDVLEERLARLDGWAELAVVNSTNIHALSGYEVVIDALVAEYRAAGVFAQRIGVDHAGHSSRLRNFGYEFSGAAAGVEAEKFADGEVLCIGATLGEPITVELPLSDYWNWNLRNTVRFDLAIASAVDHGIDTFIEMSERPTMLLSIGETLAELGVAGTVVGTGAKGVDALGEFTRNFATVAVGDSEFSWPTSQSGPVLPDFPHTRFADSAYWAADAVTR